MSIYGLEFKVKVLESLELLNSREAKEYTLSEIINVFLPDTQSKPTKQEKRKLQGRIRLCLVQWSELGFCAIEGRKHPKYKYKVLYYKIVSKD